MHKIIVFRLTLFSDPNSFVGFVTNDLGLVVDAYLFSSVEKDLEEWIYKVQQQKVWYRS